MLIRSQDKKNLINLDNVQSIYVNSSYYTNIPTVMVGFNDSDPDSYLIIGKYSTKEKAIKALDMIQQEYEIGYKVYEMPMDDCVEVEE